ncbi:MAG: hypothetical protein ACRD4J_01945 [Nitrososphaeraceae archaeon]|jgi:hypothetical protein
MHKLLELTVFVIIGAVIANLMVGSSTLIEQDVNAQNLTNASNLTGVENDSSSASVTARLNVSSPEPEPEDYPTPSPTDE